MYVPFGSRFELIEELNVTEFKVVVPRIRLPSKSFNVPVKTLLNGKISTPIFERSTVLPPVLTFISVPSRYIDPLAIGVCIIDVGNLIPIVLTSNICCVVDPRTTLNLSKPSSAPDETFSDTPITLANVSLFTAES